MEDITGSSGLSSQTREENVIRRFSPVRIERLLLARLFDLVGQGTAGNECSLPEIVEQTFEPVSSFAQPRQREAA